MDRESPWGPIPVADAHVHFFSYQFFEALTAQKSGLTQEGIREQLGWQMPPQDPEQLALHWTQMLDRHNVARAALISSVPGDEGQVIAAVRRYPQRFFGFAMVNPRTWDPARFEAIKTICLFPAMHCYSIQDEVVKPVFEWAQREQRCVFVHCGVLSVGVRERLGLASLFDMRFSNPIDLHAVALKYPEVPTIIPHFGAGYFREALMVAHLCPNVYLDTSSSNHWMRYQETHMNLRQVFQRALDVVGPKRLLFGSDSSFFPRGWNYKIFDDQARVLHDLRYSVTDARAIFGENLLRIMAP